MGYYGDWELMVGVLFKNEAGYTDQVRFKGRLLANGEEVTFANKDGAVRETEWEIYQIDDGKYRPISAHPTSRIGRCLGRPTMARGSNSHPVRTNGKYLVYWFHWVSAWGAPSISDYVILDNLPVYDKGFTGTFLGGRVWSMPYHILDRAKAVVEGKEDYHPGI